MSGWNPKLACILCTWCSYAGADSAGGNRKVYSASARIIRVPCSGRVEPDVILKAFTGGADGVLVCGCHPGDCHYQTGNYKCLRRFKLIEKYIAQMGIEPERLKLEWISASEGKQFAALVNEMTGAILRLGPSKIKSKLEVKHLKV